MFDDSLVQHQHSFAFEFDIVALVLCSRVLWEYPNKGSTKHTIWLLDVSISIEIS